MSLESQNVLLEKDISKLKDEKEELGVELTEVRFFNCFMFLT